MENVTLQTVEFKIKFVATFFFFPGKGMGVKREIYRVAQKKCIHSLLINIFGINLNEISISG